ncbi:unnamed protein product [Adineta steineri]|uniref:Uncharacterized protein n=1 Tax=Adineta steineri TaxID=433720 RepID=A0A818XNU8_9BILA|nr:unnamed protein product [Adineta steineri]CAF3743389.1 unnamed protein product [Adineta steineri]
MNITNNDETTVLISSTGIPSAVSDKRSPNQRRLAVYIILASTIFERLAFYSLAINLVVTLKSTEPNWDPSNSATASFIFFGTSYISTLIFAAVSDAKLRRSKTILIGFILYIIGYVFINFIANAATHETICTGTSPTHSSIFTEHCGPQIIGTLVFTAIGVGAVQANMAVFGAEQIQASKVTSRYFYKYFIAVNIGAVIATLSIPLVQNDSDNMTKANSYFYGYLIALFTLIISAGLFLSGFQYYIHVPPFDSVILKCIPITINAYQTWFNYRVNNNDNNNQRRDGYRGLWNNRNSISQEDSSFPAEQALSFLDYAKAANNGKYPDRIVNDVKALRTALIVYILLIPYWIIYFQIQITFPLQGQQMYIPILHDNDKIPISWMSLGDSVTIIIGISMLAIFVYKCLNAPKRRVSIRVKLITGMILASLAMCIAGTIEIFRQQNCVLGKSDSSLSIYAQLPQNICMGLAEIFATVASLEYAYLAAPRSAQSLLMSLQFCLLGFSSFLAKAYFSIYSTTTSKFDFSCLDLNKWTYTLYFFVLAGLQIPFIIIIFICDKKFKILKLNPQHTETQQFQTS